MAEGPRVLFLGMTGAFSLPPLRALLTAGFDVGGVVLPGSRLRQLTPPPSKGLPILTPFHEPNIVHLAWQHGIPVFEGLDLSLATLRPDVIVVACFARLIPPEFRAIARLAAINIHPSLLPDNRGPAPLHWTLQLGQRTTGVTVHLLADRADSGDILAQRELRVPRGIEEPELEALAAGLGAELLLEVLRRGTFDGTPQDESQATYHPFPRAS